jgi:hypothetical protein
MLIFKKKKNEKNMMASLEGGRPKLPCSSTLGYANYIRERPSLILLYNCSDKGISIYIQKNK